MTRTCSLSLIGLLSTVSGRAISSANIASYTINSINTEIISLHHNKAQMDFSALHQAQARMKEEEEKCLAIEMARLEAEARARMKEEEEEKRLAIEMARLEAEARARMKEEEEKRLAIEMARLEAEARARMKEEEEKRLAIETARLEAAQSAIEECRSSSNVDLALMLAEGILVEYGPVAAYEAIKDRIAGFSGYSDPLEQVRIRAALTPNGIFEETAVKKAFWHKIHGFIESQAPLNPDAPVDEQRYFNSIKFLTETQAPDLVIGTALVNDHDWANLEMQTNRLAEGVGFTPTELGAGTTTTRFWNSHTSQWEDRETSYISYWFQKLMICKQAEVPSGKNFVRNRTKKIVEYLQDLQKAGDENNEKIKLIIQKDIIDNAQDCPDRALAGLDNAEINIKIAESTTSEEVLGVVIEKLKKSILR